jgi:hypothetical protein
MKTRAFAFYTGSDSFFIIFFALFFVFSFSPKHVFAQTIGGQSGNQSQNIDQFLQQNGYGVPTPPAGFNSTPINITTDPATPAPNQSVTISLSSYSTDLNGANISWYVNNTLIKSAVGATELVLTTGKAGTGSNIAISIKTEEGNTVQQNLTIIPADVDLIWEANTYTPPFYQGKALYTHQSTITVDAIPTFITPSGAKISADNLLYTWKKNNTVLQDASGYGKQSIQLEDPIPEGPTVVEVDVSSLDGTITSTKQITIDSVEPQIELYQNDPLLGVMYNQSLGNELSFNGIEMTVTAVPYFFSTNDPNQNMSWNWLLNNTAVTDQTSNTITLRNENNQAGNSSLEVAVKHLLDEFQNVSDSLSISFKASNNAASVTPL